MEKSIVREEAGIQHSHMWPGGVSLTKAFLETNLAESTKVHIHLAQAKPLLGKQPTKILAQIYMYKNLHYSAAKVKI